MKRVYYNKLIGDAIPDKIRKGGGEYDTRRIEDDAEFGQELLKKVAEEAIGLSRVRSKEALLDEMADLLEVLDTLVEHEGISQEDIRAARAQNKERKGGFAKRLFLHWSSDSGYTSNETPQGIPEK